ncbi:RHS repeat-associated core domain-containing protein [uncultured Psychroserpens sp.]|uniref:RHS repeat-associated core domain-containing protein n=1 Tax=uncultured Psychroserpens sp. TaxID=255436 RepID=UPI0026042130|nr:RHS repeat-associated core domain-containing protein [uncultured Psychroserpens sp.]
MVLDYYPFGLKHKRYNNVVNGTQNNFKTYQGQELSEELEYNMLEFKYRHYDPAIARFVAIDPLASEYVYNSTYAFQENKLGLGIELEGLELVYREGTSPEFKEKFAKTVKFMNEKGTSGMLAALNRVSIEQNDPIELVDATGTGNSGYDAFENVIYWDAELAIESSPGIILSPATALNHEIDHALFALTEPAQFGRLISRDDDNYDDKEEKRVITGSEQTTAKKHGEIVDGQVTRTNHGAVNDIKVDDPTSTEGEVIEYEDDPD